MFSLNESSHKSNLTTLISITTTILVIFLAASAFILSYDALRALSAENGVSGWLAWLWPLTLDGFVITASLAVLRNNLLGDKTFYPWLLVISFSALSIAFQIWHAPQSLIGRTVAAIAPLALLLSFELLMTQLKSEVNRHNAIQSLTGLSKQADKKRKAIDALERQITAAERRLEVVKVDIKTVKKTRNITSPDDLVQAKSEKKEARIDAILAYLEANPGSTITEAGKAIGVSRQTASLYINGLTDAGRVHKNGQGWEVTA